VKYDLDVLMLVHHSNNFDGRRGHAIKDNVRVDQSRSDSSGQFVAGSSKFRVAEKSIACKLDFPQVVVGHIWRPRVGSGPPNKK
jgi:hypothetical protein